MINDTSGEQQTTPDSKLVALPRVPCGTADLPRLAFTMREAAAIIGVSYITMHRLLKRRLIHSSTAVGRKIIPRTELERFLKATLG